MAEFNRFRGGGLGSLYPGFSNLPQGNMGNRLDDRFDDRRNSRGGGSMSGFDRRDDRDFGRLPRDPSPRRRRYSPDPPYSSMRGNRRDDRLDYPMEPLGDNFSSRGQRINESEFSRAGRSLGPPNRGDGILGAKPGDIPRSSSNTGGLSSQLAQQQQHIMAMVQTQSLLAAIQAQASAAAKRGGIGSQPPSLMQGMRMHDRGRMDNRQNRKRRMSPNRQGNQRNRNQQGYRQQRSQNQRSGWQNLDRDRNQNQRRDRERSRMSESSKKSEENEPIEEPYVEENPDEVEEAVEENQKEETKETEAPKLEEPKEPKIEEPKKEQPTEKVESKTKSEEPSVNLAGQNVEHLCKSLYDKHRGKWVCKVCKIMCNKVMSFKQHLFGRRHVKTWLENQGRSFEAEIFRKATEEAAKTHAAKEQPKPAKEEKKEETQETSKEEKEIPVTKTEESAESKEEEQPVETPVAEVKQESFEAVDEPKPPSDNAETKPDPVVEKEEKKEQELDVKYSCDTRKTAVKEGDYITISSVNEARVRINGFDTGINTEGCEFVKAVSGFQCRLCKMFIARGHDVMKHVRGRKHQSNYRVYIHQHPKYEANQKMRNQELAKMLSEREGDTFLLYEVSDEEEETRHPSHYRSDSVRVTKYVVANEEEEGNASMEDKTIDPIENQNEPEPSQENISDQDKTFEEDGGGLYDPEDVYEGEKDESHLNDDIGLDSESLPKEDDSQELEENINDPVDISLDADASTDFASESLGEEEPLEKKTKVTAAAKRGRRAARGSGQGGRGRGRSRGGRRTRQSPKTASKAKPSSDESELHNEDVDFMDGFEVIDEIADDEM